MTLNRDANRYCFSPSLRAAACSDRAAAFAEAHMSEELPTAEAMPEDLMREMCLMPAPQLFDVQDMLDT